MLLKLSICPALWVGLFNGNVDSLLGALMSKHVSLELCRAFFLTMQIETVKCWNQGPLAICGKYKADLSQGDLFGKPLICYCYKWIPKLFLTPKRGKTIFPSCPQLHFQTHFLTHSLRIYSNWFLYQRLKNSIRDVQWRKKKAWPLFKTALKERHENMGTVMGVSAVTGIHGFLYWRSMWGQKDTLPLRNAKWLTFGCEGVAFCLLEEPSTFPQGNKWLLLTMGLTFPKDRRGYSISVGPQEWDAAGKAWRGAAWGSGEEAPGHAVVAQSCLVLCHPTPAPSLGDLP